MWRAAISKTLSWPGTVFPNPWPHIAPCTHTRACTAQPATAGKGLPGPHWRVLTAQPCWDGPVQDPSHCHGHAVWAQLSHANTTQLEAAVEEVGMHTCAYVYIHVHSCTCIHSQGTASISPNSPYTHKSAVFALTQGRWGAAAIVTIRCCQANTNTTSVCSRNRSWGMHNRLQ